MHYVYLNNEFSPAHSSAQLVVIIVWFIANIFLFKLLIAHICYQGTLEKGAVNQEGGGMCLSCSLLFIPLLFGLECSC